MLRVVISGYQVVKNRPNRMLHPLNVVSIAANGSTVVHLYLVDDFVRKTAPSTKPDCFPMCISLPRLFQRSELCPHSFLHMANTLMLLDCDLSIGLAVIQMHDSFGVTVRDHGDVTKL